METLPFEICMKIFCFLDHHHLAVSQQVCRKWKLMASDNALWEKLFKERWGGDHAAFYAPNGSKSWKEVYEVQDRCDRVGLEGSDYYLVHQGEVQRYLGSRKIPRQIIDHTFSSESELTEESSQAEERSCRGILDKILFFIGDLEAATVDAKRSRVI
ncbi:unnamed protein product [Vicia faba]|uniref:F-box protein n=1 Tax=Vicia faba TaxID=3906 RepID=A0AAV0ZLY0_VICFA|nr:unnamed protein product [Vicia faba]